MKLDELEPGMEELFQRLIPDLMDWEGATADEIAKIEEIFRKISGQELPKFYRWFLMRMGRSMGKFSYHDMDYSASQVISWYGDHREDEGTNFFKIGHTSDELMRLHMYYDLNHPARDDARVTSRAAEGGDDYKHFETFREMLATSAAQLHAIRFPLFCSGAMRDEADILPQLDPIMNGLGFEKPIIPVGPRCGLYEGRQATMITTGSIDLGIKSCGFVMGAKDANLLCSLLATIEAETDFTLNVQDDPRAKTSKKHP